MRIKQTNLLTLVTISLLLTSCQALSKNVKTEPTSNIKIQSVKKGDTINFDAVCVDKETFKILMKEAERSN